MAPGPPNCRPRWLARAQSRQSRTRDRAALVVLLAEDRLGRSPSLQFIEHARTIARAERFVAALFAGRLAGVAEADLRRLRLGAERPATNSQSAADQHRLVDQVEGEAVAAEEVAAAPTSARIAARRGGRAGRCSSRSAPRRYRPAPRRTRETAAHSRSSDGFIVCRPTHQSAGWSKTGRRGRIGAGR